MMISVMNKIEVENTLAIYPEEELTEALINIYKCELSVPDKGCVVS